MRSRMVIQAVLTVALTFGVGSANSAEEPYKIGMLHSFAGYLSNMGITSRDGLMLAVDEINKRGGVNGRQIKVIVENDESDPAKGVPAAVKLINGEKVLAIVGPARSDITEALGPLAEKGQVVDMTASFILPTTSGYTFATVPSPEEEARVSLEFLKKKGAKTLAILNAIDLWARRLAKAWADEAEKQGIKVVATESYNSATDKNFIPQLSKFKAANAEWMAVTGAGQPAGLILKQKTEIGYTGNVFGSSAFASAGVAPLLQIGGPAAVEGAYFATVPFSVWDTLPKEDPRYKAIVRFREAFKAKYGNYPEPALWWIAQHYDIGMLLAEGIKRAGPNVTGATLKTALEGIKDFHGVVGTFDFSPTRHAGAGASGRVIAQIKNGQVVLVK